MARQLSAGQSSRIHILDIRTGEKRLVHTSQRVLYEAPNWTRDGEALIVNGAGGLFRLPVDGSADPEPIDVGDVADINNDHVLAPDGEHVFVSSGDRHIYRVRLSGGGPTRVTSEDRGRFHFLHGVSPDGAALAYVGVEIDADGRWHAPNIFTMPSAGGESAQLTDDEFPDDGSEYSPDGEWLYFNSERSSVQAGHAQVHRMRIDGTGLEQLTFDERVNWFPHLSPDGTRMVYLSFPPGTIGHPADKDVIIRLANVDGTGIRDLVHLFGGQGTMNVPSWSPEGTHIAFVDYPLP